MIDQERPLRMNAYYYSFTPTGVRHIDLILSAVAEAGKAYHHTEDWTEELIDAIQSAANAAALQSSPSREEREQALREEAGAERYDQMIAHCQNKNRPCRYCDEARKSAAFKRALARRLLKLDPTPTEGT